MQLAFGALIMMTRFQKIDEIRTAVGIGLNWTTVVGPLSFSLSQPLTKADTDVTETFRFNLGTTF